MLNITKAIIPVAGLGTRFLPLSKVLPKEILPLVDKPMVDYSVREARDSGINHIVFILSEAKKIILEYFKENEKLESLLEERNQQDLLENLRGLNKEFEGLDFSLAFQSNPKGDGDAILKAKNQVEKEPFAVLFPDDVFDYKIPAINQLKNVFKTSQKPVVGLKRVSEEKLSSYGVVAVEKIATRLYRLKQIIEKPKLGEAPSDMAICGRYILPYEIFGYLTKVFPNAKGEIILAEAFKAMLGDGKMIYGYEIEGEWLECGKMTDWLKSNFYLCLQHKEYGPVLKEWIKKIK